MGCYLVHGNPQQGIFFRFQRLYSHRQDSFYKILTPEQHKLAHRNEYDLDSPEAIDFDLLVQCLRDLKQGYILPCLWNV